MRKKEREICEFEMYLKIFFGSLFGKKSEEKEGKGGREPFSLFPLPSSPLDQRPVHGLFFFCCALI